MPSYQDDKEPFNSSQSGNQESRPGSTTVSSRRSTVLPLCMTKTQEQQARAAADTVRSPTTKRRRTLTLTTCTSVGDIPETLDRALQMFMTYPVMKVAGTAFENSLRLTRHSSIRVSSIAPSEDPVTNPGSPTARTTELGSTTMIREAVGRTVAERPVSPRSHQANAADMVKLANAIKRAAMWQSVITATLAHTSMVNRFRVLRLRQALERHMLPTLLKRKDKTGSIMSEEACHSRREALMASGAKKQSESQDPYGTYLKENDAFFRSLGNSVLLQSFAEAMVRTRYTPGEVICRADEPSQHFVNFLVSGKCGYRRDVVDEHGAVTSKTEVLTAGNTFGGIFATNALYDGNYRALSQCIVWSLSSTDFERIFIPFADQGMTEAYAQAMRAHGYEWLTKHYRIPAVISRVPIYRHLNRPHSRYAADFEPVVRIRGEALFQQGDAPGDVYCLVDGTVKRSVKGFDDTYSSGVSSTLAPNEFATFNMASRFILLGEEPHILPGRQRYRCIVHSRMALLFRIPGERFVSALLDDPACYVQLRDRLTQQYRIQMRLNASALSFVPLLRELPESALQSLAQVAEPRVIGRSVPLCDPGQQIQEIFLVTVGDVRDPRTFGRVPTRRLPTPPPSVNSDEEDEVANMVGAFRRPGDKKAVAFAGVAAVGGKGRGTTQKLLKSPQRAKKAPSQHVISEDESVSWRWSTCDLNATMLSSTLPMSPTSISQQQVEGVATYTLVSPDEQSDFNPALPLLAAKRFLVTLGGGWEGLLCDKWPHGWEATTTVEAWAIPTLKLRTEFNNCPRGTQLSIMGSARQRQQEELGLPAIVIAKLPPMSVYLSSDSKTLAPNTATVIGRKEEKKYSAIPKRKSFARKASTLDLDAIDSANFRSRNGDDFSDGGDQHTDTFSVNFQSRRGSATPKLKVAAKPKSKGRAAEKSGGAAALRSTSPNKPATSRKAPTAEKEERVTAPPPKPSMPHFRFRKPHAAAASTPADSGASAAVVVSPRLLAVYNGELKEVDLAYTNISREPSQPLESKGGGARRSEAAGGSTGPTAASWPSMAPASKRWFSEVPSFEPLPGTAQNKKANVTLPTFATNTSLLTLRGGQAYAENLEKQTDFFSMSLTRAGKGIAVREEESAHADIPKRHAIALPKKR